MEFKTKKLRNLQIAMVMMGALSFTSCGDIEEPDGKWDPMVWHAEVPTDWQNNAFVVDANGEEFTFSCKNYSKPWLYDAQYAGEYYHPLVEDNEYHTIDWHTISLDWFKAEIKDNQLKVTFDANLQTEERPIKLTVTAGDIFYTFNFKQSASK